MKILLSQRILSIKINDCIIIIFRHDTELLFWETLKQGIYYCELFILRQLYQINRRRTSQNVYDILTKYKSSFIILEDSICLAPSNGCRTPDIVDIDNGIVCQLLLSSEIYSKLRIWSTFDI